MNVNVCQGQARVHSLGNEGLNACILSECCHRTTQEEHMDAIVRFLGGADRAKGFPDMPMSGLLISKISAI